MRVVEDNCVGCPSELGCLGSACPYKNMHIDYCDECGDDNAEYRVDGKDLCEACMDELLFDAFHDLTTKEKARLLNIDFDYIY